MPADAFNDELKRGPLADLVQRYTHVFFNQVARIAACNGLHSIEERCARWLLMTHDRVGNNDNLPLTQAFLSQMLGVRRASVTVAAGVLQSAGLIRYRHGRILIRDRAALEATACECYQAIRDAYDGLGPPS
jgi:CRP-like cAMP-binding protein